MHFGLKQLIHHPFSIFALGCHLLMLTIIYNYLHLMVMHEQAKDKKDSFPDSSITS